MSTKRVAALAAFFLCLTFSGTALAHHGSANYDAAKTVSVKGTVTDFQFVNPHVLIYMDVKDESGKVSKWQGELTNPNRLSRIGWKKDTLKPGDVITLSGLPAKSGSFEIWIQKVSLSDGTQLDTSLGGN